MTTATCPATHVHAAPVVVPVERWAPEVPSGLEPGSECFVEAAAAAGATLPPAVGDALDAIVASAPQAGALLLRGLPIGVLPRTPASPRRVADKDRTSELSLLAVARR